MNERKAEFERKSRETEIKAVLNIDGHGETKIKSNIGILDHMLELFSFHGLFDLSLEIMKADTDIDIHHTNEDIGIVLGKTFKKALGEKEGIKRFGSASAPMEGTLAHCVIDISGRGYFQLNIEGVHPKSNTQSDSQEGYTFTDLGHFLESFAHNLGATINVQISNPSSSSDLHTIMEAVFKSFGLALDQATQIDLRRKGIPSTKGIID